MKVRILQGNQAGQIVEQSRDEAESNIATGFVEAVVEPAEPTKHTPKSAGGPKAKGR